jgi:hypothetical protein
MGQIDRRLSNAEERPVVCGAYSWIPGGDITGAHMQKLCQDVNISILSGEKVLFRNEETLISMKLVTMKILSILEF